ncbi:MAG: antitoxin family protein [Desulfamplus sp.]|nr:antitoxin family protein [Desulfamplus sp.]
MNTAIEAVFDGNVFLPLKPLTLTPNSRVRIVVEIISTPPTTSFLQTARSLNLDGPSDWSKNLDNYLYGEKIDDL